MTFSSTEMVNLISSYFWPFVRISTVLMASPVFGAANIVPVRVRLVLSLAITALVVPLLPPIAYIDPMSATGMLVLLQQILLGLAMGFLLQLAFAALTLGGSSTAMPMGLGFANMVDPVNGVQVPVLSTLYTIIGTLLFLSVNGHLILIQVIIDSFTSMPVGPVGLSSESLMQVALWGGRIFMGGILIALPAIMIITLINIAFGIMTKAAPQLNIFAVGFPTTMAAGFLVIFLTLPNLLPRFLQIIQQAFDSMGQMLEVG
jgi:flagellar biosynthetic protein FliR